MHIICLGLNHETAPLQLREQLAFSDDNAKAALSRLGCGGERVDSVLEMAILSTCNRVEVYAVSAELDFEALAGFISEVQNVPAEGLNGHLYHHTGPAAVQHLFRVAAGLGSLVLGEAQILGQVAHAYELARDQKTVGPVLGRLFQAAIHAGKRARTETAIGHNPASVSSVAVRLAAGVVADLTAAQVAVLGAGEMAELTVEALRKRGVTRIQVVNRTLARAKELAERWDGEAVTFEMLPQVLAQADIIISSTSAPHTLIGYEMMEEAVAARQGCPLAMVDIAVPRDIDPQVARLAGVALYDLDALQEHLEHSLAERQRQIPHVEAILTEEMQRFAEFLIAVDVLPLIAEIHQFAESVRQNELEKTLRRLPELDEEERQRIEAMTSALVKKILHAPLIKLRSEAGGPCAAQYATLARSLFGLGDSPCEGGVLKSGAGQGSQHLPLPSQGINYSQTMGRRFSP